MSTDAILIIDNDAAIVVRYMPHPSKRLTNTTHFDMEAVPPSSTSRVSSVANRYRIARSMMNTLVGIFGNPRSAQRAMMMLRDRGLVLSALSIISRSPTKGVSVRSVGTMSSTKGAVIGIVWGAILALISLLVPSVGQFMGVSVLAITASILIGVVVGAAVGAGAAALLHFGGIPQAEAQTYESLLQPDKTLVAVKVRDKDMNQVRRILSKAGAELVQGDENSATLPLQTPV